METTNQCGGRKKTSFTKKWMWSKIKFGGCYRGQLQAEARCIVQHPGFEETGEGCVLNGGYKVVP